LRLFSIGGYRLAFAALALEVFGAYDSYPFFKLFYFVLREKPYLKRGEQSFLRSIKKT